MKTTSCDTCKSGKGQFCKNEIRNKTIISTDGDGNCSFYENKGTGQQPEEVIMKDKCEHCRKDIVGDKYTYTNDSVYLCESCTKELKQLECKNPDCKNGIISHESLLSNIPCPDCQKPKEVIKFESLQCKARESADHLVALCLVFTKDNNRNSYVEFYNDGEIGIITEDFKKKKIIFNEDITIEQMIEKVVEHQTGAIK